MLRTKSARSDDTWESPSTIRNRSRQIGVAVDYTNMWTLTECRWCMRRFDSQDDCHELISKTGKYEWVFAHDVCLQSLRLKLERQRPLPDDDPAANLSLFSATANVAPEDQEIRSFLIEPATRGAPRVRNYGSESAAQACMAADPQRYMGPLSAIEAAELLRRKTTRMRETAWRRPSVPLTSPYSDDGDGDEYYDPWTPQSSVASSSASASTRTRSPQSSRMDGSLLKRWRERRSHDRR